MAEDYYKTLGVSRNASQSDIQKAYRELARKYHPDLNPDDKTAKKKFQRVQAAFDVLNDPSKREMYDRYGSSFESAGPGPHGGPGGGPAWNAGPGAEDIDFAQFFGERFGAEPAGGFADIFSQFRKAGGEKRRGGRAAARGRDIESELTIPFTTAIVGGEVEFSVQGLDGQAKKVVLHVPPGIEAGKKMRLRGQGEPAARGGTPGDLYVRIHVAAHPYFQRKDHHLQVRVPVTLAEAAIGAKVDVPTPRGVVALRIPPGTSSGTRLRIKGHGVKLRDGSAGDLYAEVEIVLPKNLDGESLEAIRKLDALHPLEPRRDLRW
ncbi:MAG: DnaJ C-terminal domain-containing protein [Pirellulales bacterium]